MWIIKIIKIYFFWPFRILNEHWCIYSCLQITPRENWFQYVRRVYASAINFPCITTLVPCRFLSFNYSNVIKWHPRIVFVFSWRRLNIFLFNHCMDFSYWLIIQNKEEKRQQTFWTILSFYCLTLWTT